MAEDISRQPSIDFVIWLLVITLMQFCKAKGQAGQKDIQNVKFGEKEGTRKFNVGAKACAERDKEKQKNGGDQREKQSKMSYCDDKTILHNSHGVGVPRIHCKRRK